MMSHKNSSLLGYDGELKRDSEKPKQRTEKPSKKEHQDWHSLALGIALGIFVILSVFVDRYAFVVTTVASSLLWMLFAPWPERFVDSQMTGKNSSHTEKKRVSEAGIPTSDAHHTSSLISKFPYFVEPHHALFLQKKTSKLRVYAMDGEASFGTGVFAAIVLGLATTGLFITAVDVVIAGNMNNTSYCAFCLPFMMLAAVYTKKAIITQWRFRKLTRKGKLLSGEILDCQTKYFRSRATGVTVTISFVFTTPDQKRQIFGSVQRTIYQAFTHRSVPDGTPLWILYANDKCYKVL